MKKGTRMIWAGQIVRVSKGGVKQVEIVSDDPPYKALGKVPKDQLQEAMQPAENKDIYPGQELCIRAGNGWMRVEVIAGDMRYVNRGGWHVLVKDALRGQTHKALPDQLYVDMVARVREQDRVLREHLKQK